MQHVEYDINTFGGCSGSAVLFLEIGPPDFLKVIAVHAGYKNHPDHFEANFGYKLTGMRWGRLDPGLEVLDPSSTEEVERRVIA